MDLVEWPLVREEDQFYHSSITRGKESNIKVYRDRGGGKKEIRFPLDDGVERKRVVGPRELDTG